MSKYGCQTRLESYRKIIPELGERQKQVYETLQTPMSNRELSKNLRLPVNSITGRVKELREYGLVCFNRKKFDGVTGRNVVEWRRV